MDTKEKLVAIKEQQQQLLEQYERLLREYDPNKIINQNVELAKELAHCKQQLTDLENKYSGATLENQQLRVSLKEQIIDEKLNILKISHEKLNTYFSSALSYMGFVKVLEVWKKADGLFLSCVYWPFTSEICWNYMVMQSILIINLQL